MFHVELRQFPHQARAFNLTAAELRERITDPWVSRRSIELEERRFSPQKARLTIYEGPELRSEEIGMGRGWGNVTKSGREVTAAVLEQAAAPGRSRREQLREEVLRRSSADPITFNDVLALAREHALAEEVVLELLRDGQVRIVG